MGLILLNCYHHINVYFYESPFRHWRHYIFGLSVHLTAQYPKYPYVGPLVHPTNCNYFLNSPSVHPDRFPGISQRMHRGNGLKFCTLMYLDHIQNWLDYGCGLLIFLIRALFSLSETDKIWSFWTFPREHMQRMAWNFACCILTT